MSQNNIDKNGKITPLKVYKFKIKKINTACWPTINHLLNTITGATNEREKKLPILNYQSIKTGKCRKPLRTTKI